MIYNQQIYNRSLHIEGRWKSELLEELISATSAATANQLVTDRWVTRGRLGTANSNVGILQTSHLPQGHGGEEEENGRRRG
eukprot:766637-Hanusia_phi.AAC.3